MTVLSMCKDICGRLSLTQPSVVVTSTDLQVQQIFGLLKESATSIAKRGEPGWQALISEWTFLTSASAQQTNSPLPVDLWKLIPNTFFNRDTRRPVSGPLTPQQYQFLLARPALSQVYLAYRERDGQFLIAPTPTAGETIAYEYVSSYWAKNNAGAAKATFTSDDDGTYLDEELLILDTKWRWKQAKGLDYGEDMATAERAIEVAIANDGGSVSLDVGGPRPIRPAERLNVPEGSFGL